MALAQQYLGQYAEKDYYTEAEYFEFERTAFGRWEYVNGKIRQMSGGTTDHGAIASNFIRVLGNALVPRGCRVYGSDVKIHTGDGINTFPDVSVICGEHQYYFDKTDIVINPLLVVEVLSPSTEGYDRGAKFDHYRTIASLEEYLLVEQSHPLALLFTRQNSHWEMREFKGLESEIFLSSVNATLKLSDVYALIKFGPEPL